MESSPSQPFDFDALLARVQQEQRRLAPLLPDMDPGDLQAILLAILRPWGLGRYFLQRQVRPGVNVF